MAVFAELKALTKLRIFDSTTVVSWPMVTEAAPLVTLFKFNVTPGMMSLIVFEDREKVRPFTVSAALAAVASDGVLEARIELTEGVKVNWLSVPLFPTN